jgi:gamma-glutamylcyclotransferase (GGCT)/AIG2-like uncharacterized protein YtfP
MPFIFSYGTLQHDEVQRIAFGRTLPGRPDDLPRYEPSVVKIEDARVAAALCRTHHANVAFNGKDDSRVPGTVYEITDLELASADRFEAPVSYRRVAATLASGVEAWVYLHDGAREDG